MNREIIEKSEKLVQQNTVYGAAQGEEPYCVLALIDAEGYPTVSTITASKAEGIAWLTFCTGLSSNKAKRIANCHRASVCFNKDGEYNITLIGDIEVLTDAKVRQEMWYKGMEAHFQGPNDPDYCVLRFKTRRYNLFVDWQEAQGIW